MLGTVVALFSPKELVRFDAVEANATRLEFGQALASSLVPVGAVLPRPMDI